MADGRADQVRKHGGAIVRQLGRGGKSEAVGRDRHRGGQPRLRPRQVVALVRHEKGEAVADELHIQHR
ncbi:hypothetical protein SDC9_141574 [bioreactor metagenome]|uniref:Uncharacterized protein n=1 Tax=bioreactor metagenome TaxID=1076179 RepID=A0A645DZ65_9ZZZZ